ncbi:MAG: protoheme IX farnesyltransferase [Chlorobi bacterium]|nr:MAG: protoheme IX farnesyltransferase [Bacteroidota bacterium]KXK33222.1 MAG: protoheme IX farnesyltransferase [Chlorobi bacterium OLB6]MBE2265650.1 protoheme IX farnesyltransferase [Flavobacteriales bacterium]MBL1160392.1 protoheme IX farnesyltransferase [Chlorobiota bacterium]MBW7853537.1 protoheme IX farnesyltransferase [Candidatus Kapabacteria bacterium]MCC6331150.1 protoheme IX farnesyltransferase [Ignavibacteria bacterium]
MNEKNSSVALGLGQSEKSVSVVREYYELTKPGISQMVTLTTLTGYYMALPGDIVEYAANPMHWLHFLATVVGTVAVSSGSCAVNQIVERTADAAMRRTAQRPLVSGTIGLRAAWIFAAVVTILGLALLSVTNVLTIVLAIIAWLSYTVVYTPLKKHSSIALLVGGIPGALPFAGGWTAVTGTFDVTALTLFSILFFWQLPHFLALSWIYRNDYQKGGFAMHATADSDGAMVGTLMIAYSGALLATLAIPYFLNLAGELYLFGAMASGIWLLIESVRFYRSKTTAAARRVLLVAYAVLMAALVFMVTDKFGG